MVRVGAVPPAALRSLREDLAQSVRRPVWIAKDEIDPSRAFDPHRGQYLVTTLLEMLLSRPQSEDLNIIGVTDVDLFLPVFTHVFGSAQLGGSVGIASDNRLRPAAANGPEDPHLGRERLLKVILHELGHTMGLVHCRLQWCAMSPSRLPEQVDLKDAAFCDNCTATVGMTAPPQRPLSQ